MSLHSVLEATATYSDSPAFDAIRRNLAPEWIEEALAATGTATLRRRRLPAEQVVWLVIGMALYRDRSIEDVVAKLDLCLPDARRPSVAPSAISPARKRLGEEPIRWLFQRTAVEWAHGKAAEQRWRGLSVYGFDGTTVRTPDTQENLDAFGRSNGARGEGGFPLVRLVALQALRSHLLADTCFGGFADVSEIALAEQLLDQIPDDSVTIVDRNFFNARMLIPLMVGGSNRHWIVRGRSRMNLKPLDHIGDGEWIVEMQVPAATRRKHPGLPMKWRARGILWAEKGQRPRWFLTSLLDPETHPAAEVVAMYAERWEIEQGYDEIKTDLLESEATLRSKSPAGIRQELWGVLLTYNLVRLEMAAVAEEAGVKPTQISFVASLRQIQDEWMWCAVASPGAIPKHLRRLREDLKRFILPPRRGNRSYPRAVKIKMSSYSRKRSELKRKKAK